MFGSIVSPETNHQVTDEEVDKFFHDLKKSVKEARSHNYPVLMNITYRWSDHPWYSDKEPFVAGQIFTIEVKWG